MEFTPAEIAAVAGLDDQAAKVVKMLKSRKTVAARDAYFYIDRLPRDLLAFVQAEYPQGKVLGKVRSYLLKWRPLRLNLPAGELDALGVPRGPQFNQVLEEFFALQLRGKGRTPPERTRLLCQLAGVKLETKKPAKKKKEARSKAGAAGQKGVPPAAGAAAKKAPAPSAPVPKGAGGKPPAPAKRAAAPLVGWEKKK